MDDTLIIDQGFNGPRLSGNGGYVGGVLAARFRQRSGGDGAVEITLRAPIPIETPLKLLPDSDGALLLCDGDTVLCEAREGSVDDLRPPPPPTDWNQVMRQAENGGSPAGSEFGHCIVCGRGRAEGDGLRVFGCATEPGHSLACYLPHAVHADAMGRIRPEFVWGTLDCPGAWAAQDADDDRPAMTGRMAVKVMELPRLGERCAVVGWRIGTERRKIFAGTALYTEGGRLCGLGLSTWILPKG